MQPQRIAPDALFDRIFHASPVAMAITTADEYRFVAVNRAYTDLVGLSREELIGRRSDEFGHLDDAARQRITADLRDHGHLLDTPLCVHRPDGTTRDVVASIQIERWSGQTHAISLYQDLTDHRRTQDDLHSAETRFRLFYEGAPLPVLIHESDSLRIVDVNPATCALYGYSYEEMLSLSILDLWPLDDRLANLTRIKASGLNLIEADLRHLTKDGSVIDVQVVSYPLPQLDSPARLAIIRDVTGQKAMLEALRRNEERLRLLADMTTNAIWETDFDAGTTVYSGGIESQFGYAPGLQTAPDWWLERVHPDDRPRLLAKLTRVFAERPERSSDQYRYRRADGRYAHVLDRGRLLLDETGRITGMAGTMVDITHEVELRDAADQATLAERRRLTHNLDDVVAQSLYSVSLMAEAARRRIAAGDMVATIDYVDRLGELGRQSLKEMRLLVFELRPEVLQQRGLLDALQTRLDAVERRAGVRVGVSNQLTAELAPTLQGDLYHLAQEALNSSLKHSAASMVEIVLGNDESHVHLTISDNGRGLDPQNAADWITLGLASLREQVHNLGGALAVDSRPGAGTNVIIRLALWEGENGQSDPNPDL